MNAPFALQRRQWLAYAASLAAPFTASSMAAAHTPRLVTAWEGENGYRVGVLTQRGAALAVSAALDVPTRAHGVWAESGGSLLAVARRPGDWLLRWKPDAAGGGQALVWGWIEPDRAFNGHVVASPDGRLLYTTETNLETGQGLIGLRDAATLEKTGEWPTHGMDPHELLLGADGSLMVANGGIPALPETGRLKIHMDRMDASLVRLDTRSGALLGQWRLADQRLSLRHIAWGEPVASGAPGQRQLGIALQAEHDDAAAKAAAPVLAMFDGQRLQTHDAGPGQQLAGYGGDIAPTAGGFAVSCPRANGVALWRADGRWAGFLPLQEACALATAAPGGEPSLWAAGRLAALTQDSRGATRASALKDLRLDNHWAALG
ncbi:hypothetical protein PMI15_00601 [Polaromonas sp. CF318]|uniref:DUF1513 domain-containing protein n=1 Tax=Polaromonas sp. CF318 TaxID=1144318 RepID=UPI000270DAD0|nr:DUF1513 domain-containing protein [Polaromonas sp. CF318]EJL89538.1 hypothetical protein PMI15_00601 [Polaromonas sp. CF318]